MSDADIQAVSHEHRELPFPTEPEEAVAECSECDIWYALLNLHRPVTRAATPPTDTIAKGAGKTATKNRQRDAMPLP